MKSNCPIFEKDKNLGGYNSKTNIHLDQEVHHLLYHQMVQIIQDSQGVQSNHSSQVPLSDLCHQVLHKLVHPLILLIQAVQGHLLVQEDQKFQVFQDFPI